MTGGRFDVVIAGGGPAGAAAALTLVRKGRRVLIANARSRRQIRAGESFVASAVPLLSSLGVLEQFTWASHLKSYSNISFWGSTVAQARDSIHDLQGCGYQLNRDEFDRMLMTAAQKAGAVVCPDTAVISVQSPGASPGAAHRSVELRTQGESVEATCTWLLDATGRSASLSRQLGARRGRLDRLLAFSVRLGARNGIDQDASAVVEAAEAGWWYSTLVSTGQRLVCLFTDADLADHQKLLRPEGFMSALEGTREISRLVARNGYKCLGLPEATDASSARLDVMSGNGWIAVGDSAISFDPLAARGIASAIYAGIRTGEAVDAGLAGQREAIGQHVAHQQAIFTNYLYQLKDVYSWERRWPRSEFWRRRHCWRLSSPNF